MSSEISEEKRVGELIKSEAVQFVNFQFTDLVGCVKQISVPVEQWARAQEHGIWFDGSSIDGFARVAESDMYLKPDLSTFAVIPWRRRDLVTARVICDVFTPDGEPFPGDPRHALRRACEKARSLGYEYNVGPEFEFFLFKKGPTDEIVPLKTHDEAGYFDVSTDLAHTVRRQMMRALAEFNIEVEASHHECGISQSEIDIKYGPALQIADNAVTLRLALKAIAQLNGLYCTFMPKPLTGIAGSGMHVHQSLMDLKTGKNVFADLTSKDGLSSMAKSFVAGQLQHARGLCVVLSPLVNSFKRLVPGWEAPTVVSWAQSNRSALIRVPRVRSTQPQATRVELRCPDPSANPYLVFTAMLYAGLDGVNRNLEAPPPSDENLFAKENAEARQALDSLPEDLGEGIRCLKADPLMREALGPHIFDRFVEAKTLEWNDYRHFVSQWELDRYLARY